MPIFKKTAKFLLLTVTLFTVTSCANLTLGNLFSHYSAQIKDVYVEVKSGRYLDAHHQLADNEVGGDILSQMEIGRVAFLAEDYDASLEAFKQSDVAWQTLNDRATVSLSNTGNQIGSLASNDNLVDYEPGDFELGYMHLYLGLNYIQKNDLTGALVEMRRANQVQEQAQKTRKAELASAQASLAKQGIQANIGSVLSNYAAPSNKLQAIQNAYLLYLSALLYETDNQLNDAYIDLKRALAVYPNNKQIAQHTMRVAKRLGMRSDLSKLTKQYGSLKSRPNGYGEIVILEERDVVALRDSWSTSLPVYGNSGWRLYNVALPTYKNAYPQRFSNIKLSNKNVSSSLIADTNAMAEYDLTERLPVMLINQGMRLYSKDQLRREAAKNDSSGVANVLLNIWNSATEQPDTRTWHTLPAQVYSASEFVKAGEHSLDVNGQTYSITVKANQRTLVWMSRQGNAVTLWTKSLGAISL